MKKNFLTVLISLGIICIIGFGFSRWVSASKEGEVMVLENLPFEIEKNNPVPEVRHWDLGQKTYYYFNWGLKPTGGYNLELSGVEKDVIKIKAVVPQQDQMLIQVLTFPYLLISLPRGKYHYEVTDKEGRSVKDIFTPKNSPLKMTIFLPRNEHIAKRKILRDPYFNNEGKTPVLIALEALFNQEEMLDYVYRGILPEKVAFSSQKQKWYILMGKPFEQLDAEQKNLLHELVSKTILSLSAENPLPVEIITDPAVLTGTKD